MSFFDSLKLLPEDPIFGLHELFLRDPRPSKVNLSVGVYKNDAGICEVLSSVRKAEKRILEKGYDKQYLPMLGSREFIDHAQRLLFDQTTENIFSVQTLGGTGALRLGCELFCQTGAPKKIHLSDPTWPNHRSVAMRAGLEAVSYPYYDPTSVTVHLTALKAALHRLPAQSLVLLQPCCHNPTGCDPDPKSWEEISGIMKERLLIPFFDLAYLGFGEGLTEDKRVIDLFFNAGHEMLIATSFSKNFGLYGERVGLFTLVLSDAARLAAVKSQLQQLIRSSYSMPPLQGARIVTEILSDSALKAEWMNEVAQMRQRIAETRRRFVQGLTEKSGSDHFLFLNRQRGMFSFSGLGEENVQRLRKEFAIYIPENGRINVAGINSNNIDLLLDAFIKVAGR